MHGLKNGFTEVAILFTQVIRFDPSHLIKLIFGGSPLKIETISQANLLRGPIRKMT